MTKRPTTLRVVLTAADGSEAEVIEIPIAPLPPLWRRCVWWLRCRWTDVRNALYALRGGR